MNSIELILLNMKEVRRRSLKVWKSIPKEALHWKPDTEAMNCLEMIRHVLESEHYYHLAILNEGSPKEFNSPFENRPLTNVEDEVEFAEQFRKAFLKTVSTYTDKELSSIQIDRSESGYIRSLGDMLLRIPYHEAVHTGQLLDYLRSAGFKRERIWD
ncbi:DinB family protein [Rossellomorea marisflavi]|uniref:DinB family protein n=1 Tax=Rossellomorea marisflavi TaxID=189381 RepID=A0A5D4R9U5_9BACI|nr:DinB family protein [Rossellomorea marisflavi]TYS48243.1 DinB family protein [Rossellomorea marisflavi]